MITQAKDNVMNRSMARVGCLLITLYFLSACAPYDPRIHGDDPNYPPIRRDNPVETALYTDENIVIYDTAKWVDGLIDNWTKDLSKQRLLAEKLGKDGDKRVELVRRTDSIIPLMIEEIKQGECHFLRLGFRARGTINILGPGALVFVMQDADGKEIRIPDMGIIFAGPKNFTWKADTLNGPVTVNRHYSLYQRSDGRKSSPQHCMVRMPRHATKLKLLRIELNPEQCGSGKSVASASY